MSTNKEIADLLWEIDRKLNWIMMRVDLEGWLEFDRENIKDNLGEENAKTRKKD